MVTRCYKTCSVVRSTRGATMMVDAGGGNGILNQMAQAGLAFEDISDLFVTHTHTDHILGVIWMMRMALQYQKPQVLHIHSHKKARDLLDFMCRQMLPKKQVERIGTNVVDCELYNASISTPPRNCSMVLPSLLLTANDWLAWVMSLIASRTRLT